MAKSSRHFMLTLAGALAVVVAFGTLVDAGREERQEARAAAPSGPLLDAAPRPTQEARSALAALTPNLDLSAFLAGDGAVRFARWVPLEQPSLLDRNLILSYYGHPSSPAMGILGSYPPETVIQLLLAHARRYDQLNGPARVVPALHLVYAVAQRQPTPNQLYLAYTGEEEVQRYVELTKERGMLLFLDLQIGRSTVARELERVVPYLRYPQVHLALDPEFAVAPTQVPGVHLGSLSAADINEAQATLQRLVEEERLPPKILIVHQFVDSMIAHGEELRQYAGVDLVIDVDGFGPAAVKRSIYQRYANRPYAQRPAIKLFFQQDPDLMTEQEVLSLVPMPAVVVYQ